MPDVIHTSQSNITKHNLQMIPRILSMLAHVAGKQILKSLFLCSASMILYMLLYLLVSDG